jgi:hypothetical protein
VSEVNSCVTKKSREQESSRVSVLCECCLAQRQTRKQEENKSVSLSCIETHQHKLLTHSPLSFVDTHNSHFSDSKTKNAFPYARIISSPLLYYMYLLPFCYIAHHPCPSPCSSSQATKLSLLISLLTKTPLSSSSLCCLRCEKSGNSYFVPGCSTLRLGSKRRKNAVKGREGDAGESEWLKWVVMAGDVEALEHVGRELFSMSVIHSKRGLLFYGRHTFLSLQSKKISSTEIS